MRGGATNEEEDAVEASILESLGCYLWDLWCGTTQITVASVGPSTTVDTEGAVDATVHVGDITGEVTLIPRESDGQLDSWGQLDHWASPELHGLSRQVLDEIVARVVAEA